MVWLALMGWGWHSCGGLIQLLVAGAMVVDAVIFGAVMIGAVVVSVVVFVL